MSSANHHAKMALTTVARGLESYSQQPSHLMLTGEAHCLVGDRTREEVERPRGIQASCRSAATGTGASHSFVEVTLLIAILTRNGERGGVVSLSRPLPITLAILLEVGRREAESEVPVKPSAFARTRGVSVEWCSRQRGDLPFQF
jgi:hypothetical protein